MRGFSALRICFLVELCFFSHDTVSCSSSSVLLWVFRLGTWSSSSDSAEHLGLPWRGLPSWKPQYWIPAATALLCHSHSSSSESVVGHVKNISTRSIYSGGIVNTFYNTSCAGSSLTVPPVSCLSISITTCFQLNSHCASFCHLSCRQWHRLLTLYSWSSSISCNAGSPAWLLHWVFKSASHCITDYSSGSFSTNAQSASFRYCGHHQLIQQLIHVTALKNSSSGLRPHITSCKPVCCQGW